MLKQSSLALMVVVALSGCSSTTTAPLINPPKQAMLIQTLDVDKLVAGVTCTLANDQGQWTVTTPGTVEVTTSEQDLVVTCTNKDANSGTAKAVSSPTPSVFVHPTAAVVAPVGAASIIEEQLRGITQAYPSTVQVMLNQDIIVTASQ